MNLDILAIGPHPDDCEIFMGGTLLALKTLGYKIAVVDLTAGEMGTYGDRVTRARECEKASALLGLETRLQLGLPDGAVANVTDQQKKVVDAIRQTRPKLVFTFHEETRHPDHRACAQLVRDSVFFAGLEKWKGNQGELAPHRPEGLLHFFEHHVIRPPDFCVDISAQWLKKIELVETFGSQVLPKGQTDAQTKTFIRSDDFWRVLEARAVLTGHLCGVKYAEGFLGRLPPRLSDVMGAFARPLP